MVRTMFWIISFGLVFNQTLVCNCYAQNTESPYRGVSESEARELLKVLGQRIPASLVRKDMTVREVISEIDKFLARNEMEIVILVNVAAFKKVDRSIDVWHSKIKTLPSHGDLTVSSALSAIAKALPGQGMIALGPGFIEITTSQSLSNGYSGLQQLVAADFDGMALREVLQELSRLSGVAIITDPRVHENSKKASIKVLLANVTIRAAVFIVADMADLKVVIIDNALYVTTPERFRIIQRELRKSDSSFRAGK